MVFQDHALWPHLSVLDTVAYPLRRAGAPKSAARRAARDILEQMGLGPLAERRPGSCPAASSSGSGWPGRWPAAPGIYLFDEPTAHLDASLRAQILEEVARRRAADGAAAIYATHDAAEALAIADRVAVLHSGRMAQAGPPAEVYAAPDDLTVAAPHRPGVGPACPIQPGDGGPVHHRSGRARATVPGSAAGGAPASSRQCPARRPALRPAGPALLVRPDWALLGAPGRPDAGGDLPGSITDVRFRGPHTDYHLATPAGPLLIREAGPPRAGPGPARWSLLRVRLMPVTNGTAVPDRKRWLSQRTGRG